MEYSRSNMFYNEQILKNKLNIKDFNKLLKHEKLLIAIKSMYYFNSNIQELDFDIKRLIETNKFLIEDIYDFSSEVRNFDISEFGYCERYDYLIDLSKTKDIINNTKIIIENLNMDYSSYSDIEKKYMMCAALADLYEQHPFYRANTLTIILFISDYAREYLDINIDLNKFIKEYDVEKLICDFTRYADEKLFDAIANVEEKSDTRALYTAIEEELEI